MATKNKWLIALVLIGALILSFRVFFYQQPNKLSNEEKCLNFLNSRMTSPGGAIYTNYLDLDSQGEETKGHDILAESEGLILLYYLEANQQGNFDVHFEFITRKMLLKHKLIGWRLANHQLSPVSSTVDDLRIAKALLGAYSKWGDLKYQQRFLELEKALKEYAVHDQLLVDFYDSQNKGHTLTLAYIDLVALGGLIHLDKEWLMMKKNCEEIIASALISHDFPLYRKTYYLDQKTFSQEENIEVLYSMMVALSLAQDGQAVQPFCNWLKEKIIVDGAIYAEYNSQTGKPTNKRESTAIYALGALLAAEHQDKELYLEMIKLMGKYQVQNPKSPIYGAFGEERKLEVYSFDNLQALLAFQKGVKNDLTD